MSKIHPLVLVALAVALTACSGTEQSKSADMGAKKADNTAVNARDRNDATVTPMDQGGSEADVALTRSIRQAITANDAFSVNAKNVKIITLNGVVTLRGPVDSAEEKTRIADMAQAIAGVSRVDNQLEVAARTSY